MKCVAGLTSLLLVLGLPAQANALDPDSSSTIDRAFQLCSFAIDLTSQIRTFGAEGQPWLASPPGYCVADLKVGERSDFVTLGGSRAPLRVWAKPKDLEQLLTENRFTKNRSGHWKFLGKPVLSGPRFKKVSTEEIPEKDGMTLVGRARQTGYTPRGAELTVSSACILRIASDFVVTVEIAFEPYYFPPNSKSSQLVGVPKSKIDGIVEDLVKIVRSVRIAPE